jgi:homoserine kinase
MHSIKVKSSATLSNLCCGFDILGLALNEPYDIIELIKKEEPGILIKHKDSYQLSADPKVNISGVALQAMMDSLNYGKEIN